MFSNAGFGGRAAKRSGALAAICWLAVVCAIGGRARAAGGAEDVAAGQGAAKRGVKKAFSPPRETAFRLGEGAREMQIWGKSEKFPRAYFDELLPAIFERTLVFDRFEPAGSRLDWIFTGDHAGFTVRIEPKKITVFQRYYDSFALNEVKDNAVKPQRNPEKIWRTSEVAYDEPLRELKVALGHKLDLVVTINGGQQLAQKCEFDVSRHQLFLDGDKGMVEGKLIAPATKNTTVRIDRARKFQKMLGWGGIASQPAYAHLSDEGRKRWWDYVAEYNLLIQREYPIGTNLNRRMTNWETLADAVPHYYGDNFPNGEIVNFDYNRTMRGVGGLVMFEFWQLPPWATRDAKDEKGRVQKGVADPDRYVEAMLGYVKASVERSGAPPEILGIQNERQQPGPVWSEMTRKLRAALDDAGFRAVRIHAPDNGSLAGGLRSMRIFQQSRDAWKALDYAATHMYDYQEFFTNPDSFDGRLREWAALTGDKPFISTELCINNPAYQLDSYRVALAMGQLYHKNLSVTNAIAICYCWTILSVVQPSYGWTRSLFVPDDGHGAVPRPSSNQLRVFGAFSRRIRRDMVRIGAEADDGQLLVTAYENGDKRMTVVMLNRSAAPQRVRIEEAKAAFTELEIADPYRENAVVRLDKAAEEAAEVVVAPGAFVTLTNVPLGKAPKK